MKITIDKIKGSLKAKVQLAIDKAGEDNVIGLFAFNDIDHQYPWRSKGPFISVRIKTESGYTSTNIYYKKA